ncbi:EAL domain-containing protein [Raoultibacter phocaeensis]|uniref:EAL domain-containing protein n=1 Tax=Raoultibacter phocaeensis TaxID=2479841 RepID=UPI00111AACE2|nr:EAL domain-containing protein [Raoultibacter phocaeensis]
MTIARGVNEHDKVFFDSVLAGLSELVYMCDAETYELVYLNQAGVELFGTDIVGKPCYEVLQGKSEPCSFCTNDRLGFETFYEWEHTNETTGGHYLLRDKLLDWDGRAVRLEIAFDITDRTRESELFRFQAEANAMVVESAKLLERETGFSLALDEVLGKLGTFLCADRAYVFEIEGERMSNTYEWCNAGVQPHKSELQNMPLSLIDHWLARFKGGEAAVIEDVRELPDDRADERAVLVAQDIVSLVAVPIEIDGRLAGYLGIDNPAVGGLEAIEMQLVGLTYFVAANMKRAATQRQLDELTWNDPLTRARSRAAFHRDYDRGRFECIGMALIDVDRLSIVNRELGRSAGDELLSDTARCLHSVFGEGVYRVGDDEFCAVSTPIGYEEFADLSVRAMQRLGDEGIHASLGSAWHGACDSTAGLLDLAGDRMRSAKRGRHRATDLGVDLASDAAVSTLLRPGGAKCAAEAGLLSIHLMPQASAVTGEILGAEALIRFCDRERGMQALPSSFIPALEDMGEIAEVDFFALSKACETIARWQREGRNPVPLAVNFSRRTIGDEGFVARISDTVASYGLDPSFIEIEITESAREESEALLHDVADGLRSSGFRVAIDDFGVDNANYQLFIQLEFDVLKIDKSLVWGLGTEARTMQVIQNLVDLCNGLGIETVAEGIESKEQLTALREAGCTRAQGYSIGKPKPIEEFERRFMR